MIRTKINHKSGSASTLVELKPHETEIALYEDSQIRLSKSMLVIHHYLLLETTKFIDLNDIIFVHPANGWKEEDGRAVGCIGAASWGMGNTGIFWSRDFSRVKYCLYANQESLQNSIVLKRKGGWGRIGFTVDDMEKFWEALERVRPGSIEG